jgi:lipopolysaccharide export LptBFGC system permease protein LptF
VPRSENDLSLWHLALVQNHPELADRVRLLKEETPEPVVQYHKDAARTESMAEMHKRLAAALGCFGLVLVGAGLGMYFHSGHLLTAFGVALAPWLGATVLTMTAVKAVCRATANPHAAVWMVWLPNVVVVLLGLAILAYLTWFWASPVRLRHLVWRRRG